MKETILGKDNCPNCGKYVDACSSAFGDHTPKPGDISVCIGCGEALKFKNDMGLEVLSGSDFNNLDDETQRQLLIAKKIVNELKVAAN